MVNQCSIRTRDSLPLKRLANMPGKLSQRIDTFIPQFLPMIFNQKEPVPSPRDITRHSTIIAHLHTHIFGIAISRHIVNSNPTIRKQFCRHHTYRRLDAMQAWLDAPQKSQRRDEADGAMPTHSQIGNVVEENNTSTTNGVPWFAEQRTNDHIRPPWLVDDSRTEPIEALTKYC